MSLWLLLASIVNENLKPMPEEVSLALEYKAYASIFLNVYVNY